MTEYVDGNRLTVLESGREYFPALEAACDAAVHEIHVETYIYEDDEAGQRVAGALMRAARLVSMPQEPVAPMASVMPKARFSHSAWNQGSSAS